METNYTTPVKDYETGKDHGKLLKVGLSALAAFLALCVVLMIAVQVYSVRARNNLNGDRKETIVDKIISKIMSESIDVALPTRYVVPEKYIIPPTDQMQRGTCWAFGALLLLESQYKAYGLDQGWLNESEYVSFSEQAYLKWLGETCQKRQDVAACQHGGFGDNQTSDHKLDSIYYFARAFPELQNYVLPEAVCPYQGEDEGQWICDGMEEALETNPISWKIKSMRASGTIEGAKKLLIEAGRPIGIGVPINSVKYWAPCDDSNYSSDAECVNQETKCPEGFGYTSTYCKTVIVDNRIRDGTFTYVDDLKRTVPAGGHAMDVVGYNDDWVYKARKGSERGLANLKGGFILHNSWRAPGHSVDFLLGRLSEENEAVQCPNHLSPMNWIPSNSQCVKDNKGDTTKCGTDYQRVRGKGLTTHMDVLKCIKADYCDENRKYALAELGGDVDVQSLFSGFDRVHIFSWTGDASDIVDEYIDYFPFWALKTMFEPVDLVENDPDSCGYWMYPYDAIAQANKAKISLFDTFHVTDIEFEFTNSSYERSPERDDNKYDYTLLSESTKVMNRMKFDQALPYNIVY